MIITRFLAVALLLTLVAGSLSAYVLLSPRRTWDGVPNLIIDSRGNSTITDGNGGTTRIRSAIVSTSAWNGAGTGTRTSMFRAQGSLSWIWNETEQMVVKEAVPVQSAALAGSLTRGDITRPL